MSKYLMRSHLFIPASEFTDKIRKRLTFRNPDIDKYRNLGRDVPDDVPDHYTLFLRIPEHNLVRVPRYTFGQLSTFLDMHDVIEDTPDNPIEIEYTSKEKPLNKSQVISTAKALDFLAEEYGTIIVGEPAEGKTLMGVWIICELKVKTVVLVHKDSLIEQWRESLLELTDIKESEIGLLQNGKFKDGKVVIGSQASLMRETISSEVNKLFPFKIQDEVHRIGATMFLKSFTRFNSRYVLGLSATPDREDKLERLYFFHTSDNLVLHTAVRRVPAKYFSVKYTNKKTYWKQHSHYTPYRTALLHNLEIDADRNNLLMSLLVTAVDDGRTVLAVGTHIIHLEKFLDVVRNHYSNKNVLRFFGARKLTKAEKSDGIKQEKYTDPKREELLKADIIIATFKKAMEGVDIPPIDTLLFLSPFGSKVTLKQVIGRIERAYPDKKQPIVIDLFDTKYALTKGMANKRLRIYEEIGKSKYSGEEFDRILNNI
jgi:superfamily II DNA or RNA helicase